KGEIEVKKVWMTYSEVSIIEVYDVDAPLVDGDLIVNPLYNPRRPVRVVFAGEERLNMKKFPSTVEAANRIREMGGTVQEKVGLDTDYVIFTESRKKAQRDVYSNFKKAILLEIPIAEVDDIFRFIGD
ncbi:MAG: BRCT domain-containing protein, partial [Planctomycetota bacterium]